MLPLASADFPDRKSLRLTLRQRRRSLSVQQQSNASQNLCRRLIRQPLFVRSRHIALYLPNDGEIDPRPLLAEALKRGKRCYLPVLAPGSDNRLWFMPYDEDTVLIKNRFGIPEPAINYRKRFIPQRLDLVLMPLVGFDVAGGRMGMGGGFYDRTFAFKQKIPQQKTYLLGLAHGCQQVDQLPIERWDIPLNAIATDEKVLRGNQSLNVRDFIA